VLCTQGAEPCLEFGLAVGERLLDASHECIELGALPLDGRLDVRLGLA
jgi:hypothetical protein